MKLSWRQREDSLFSAVSREDKYEHWYQSDWKDALCSSNNNNSNNTFMSLCIFILITMEIKCSWKDSCTLEKEEIVVWGLVSLMDDKSETLRKEFCCTYFQLVRDIFTAVVHACPDLSQWFDPNPNYPSLTLFILSLIFVFIKQDQK